MAKATPNGDGSDNEVDGTLVLLELSPAFTEFGYVTFSTILTTARGPLSLHCVWRNGTHPGRAFLIKALAHTTHRAKALHMPMTEASEISWEASSR